MSRCFLVAGPSEGFANDVPLQARALLARIRTVFARGDLSEARRIGLIGDDHRVVPIDVHAREPLAALVEADEDFVVLGEHGAPGRSDDGWELVALILDHHPDVELVPVGMSSWRDAALAIAGVSSRTFVSVGTWSADLAALLSLPSPLVVDVPAEHQGAFAEALATSPPFRVSVLPHHGPCLAGACLSYDGLPAVDGPFTAVVVPRAARRCVRGNVLRVAHEAAIPALEAWQKQGFVTGPSHPTADLVHYVPRPGATGWVWMYDQTDGAMLARTRAVPGAPRWVEDRWYLHEDGPPEFMERALIAIDQGRFAQLARFAPGRSPHERQFSLPSTIEVHHRYSPFGPRAPIQLVFDHAGPVRFGTADLDAVALAVMHGPIKRVRWMLRDLGGMLLVEAEAPTRWLLGAELEDGPRSYRVLDGVPASLRTLELPCPPDDEGLDMATWGDP